MFEKKKWKKWKMKVMSEDVVDWDARYSAPIKYVRGGRNNEGRR